MNRLIIGKEELVSILEEAFEKGYHGYLELKEDIAEEIIKKSLDKKLIKEQFSIEGYSTSEGLVLPTSTTTMPIGMTYFEGSTGTTAVTHAF